MLNSLFTPIYDSTSTLTAAAFLAILGSALVLGALLGFSYRRHNRCSRSFAVTLATLPAVVSVIILMVSGSIGAGVAVAGTFSLVRFRSAPGTAREIAALFIAMALGLACGMGCPVLAAVFTVVMCLVDLLYSRLGSLDADERRLLSVTIPEGLEYAGMFDDLFETYTRSARLVRVKTTNLGSLNRLSYEISLKEAGTEKALIDQIRVRNGNLEISLSQLEESNGEL